VVGLATDDLIRHERRDERSRAYGNGRTAFGVFEAWKEEVSRLLHHCMLRRSGQLAQRGLEPMMMASKIVSVNSPEPSRNPPKAFGSNVSFGQPGCC
jgi:hypothetical protein